MELKIGGENAGVGIEHDHISFILLILYNYSIMLYGKMQ